MKTVLKIFTWLLVAAITFVTLGPARYRPYSGLGQDGDHAIAFLLLGLSVGLAYSQRRLIVAALTIFFVGLLEIVQLWAPGRHARLEDFLVDAATACVGLTGAAAVGWLASRWRGSRPQ